MKMKKIISALAVGAVAVGFATADLTISANPKVSGMWYRYNTTLQGGSGLKQKELFNLPGYGGAVKGTVTMKASGDIFTFTAAVVPILATASSTSPSIDGDTLTIAANLGNFTFTTGWTKGGIKTLTGAISGGNDEGNLGGTAYKLGSGFASSPLHYSNNQTAFGKDKRTYFAHAKYGIPLGDVFTLNVAASAMSPHGFASSEKTYSESAENVEDEKWYGQSAGTFRDNHSVGWGVFLNPVVKKIVSVEAFAKGVRLKTDDYAFFLGGYANLLCVPIIKDSAFGGSLLLTDDCDVQEWNADLNFIFTFGNITLGLNNKFSAMPDNSNPAKGGMGVAAGAAVGYGTAYINDYLLYNALRLDFKLNDTLTLTGNIGQQSAFGDGQKGTTVYVYPEVTISASSAATISAGAALTLDRIGANFETLGNKKMALLVNVPVVVKFSL